MKFPWGRVIQKHEIGKYWIVEYHPYDNFGSKTCKIDETKTNFSLEEFNTSYESLDLALLGLVCSKYKSESLIYPIAKMIGMLDRKDEV